MKNVTIYLFGDSTLAYNKALTYPQTGWGQVLPLFCKEGVQVINLAKNGKSTRTFYEEGLYLPALQNMKEGDYVLIQFGHNDQLLNSERYTDPFGSYQMYLERYIDLIKEQKGNPILLTPIYRRYFDDGVIRELVHLDYPRAMMEVASRKNVPCIDMTTLSYQLLKSLGDEESKKLYMNLPSQAYPNYPDGKVDNTHLVYHGAFMMAQLFVQAVKKENLPLADAFL